MYERYDGFYVWVHKDGRIHHPKLIAKYLGRYVRHPAIANSRITSFDGSDISFYYEDREKQRHNATMSLEEFISALIQHIPERQFKMIRYYGAYARGTKKLFKAYLLSSIAQLKLCRFGFKRPKKELRCPYCKGELEFVWFLGKPPPEELKSQRELAEWFSENFKN